MLPDILRHRNGGHQVEILREIFDKILPGHQIKVRPQQLFSIPKDLALYMVQPVYKLQQGTFPASTGADQGNGLPFGNFQAQVFNEGGFGITEGDFFEIQHGTKI